jgi:hypothetical protein
VSEPVARSGHDENPAVKRGIQQRERVALVQPG